MMITYTICDQIFEVVYVRKEIKQTYLRMNRQNQIIMSTRLQLSENEIISLLDNHQKWIIKQINKQQRAPAKDVFFWFGVPCDKNGDYTNHRLQNPYKNKTLWEKEGLEIISKMFAEARTTHQLFGEPKLIFKKMKSKWGICHYHKKIIVLNKMLIHIPKPLITYIIFHELSHLVHPNHSEKFYLFLQDFVPDYKEKRKQLKTYGIILQDT